MGRENNNIMKGLALTTIAIILIAVAGLGIFLSFFSGPFSQMLTDTFCFFNNHVFFVLGANLAPQLCKPIECRGERVVLEPLSSEDLVKDIAAYSLMCWNQKGPECGNMSMCYDLVLRKNPLKSQDDVITEIDLTKYLEEQGACSILENSIVVNPDGTRANYTDYTVHGSCGDEDLVTWSVLDNSGYHVIWKQSLIIIMYDIENNKIWIKA